MATLGPERERICADHHKVLLREARKAVVSQLGVYNQEYVELLVQLVRVSSTIIRQSWLTHQSHNTLYDVGASVAAGNVG